MVQSMNGIKAPIASIATVLLVGGPMDGTEHEFEGGYTPDVPPPWHLVADVLWVDGRRTRGAYKPANRGRDGRWVYEWCAS